MLSGLLLSGQVGRPKPTKPKQWLKANIPHQRWVLCLDAMWVWASTLQQVQDHSQNQSVLPAFATRAQAAAVHPISANINPDADALVAVTIMISRPLAGSHSYSSSSSSCSCQSLERLNSLLYMSKCHQCIHRVAFDSMPAGQPAINSAHTCICADGCEPYLSYCMWGLPYCHKASVTDRQRPCVDATTQACPDGHTQVPVYCSLGLM